MRAYRSGGGEGRGLKGRRRHRHTRYAIEASFADGPTRQAVQQEVTDFWADRQAAVGR